MNLFMPGNIEFERLYLVLLTIPAAIILLVYIKKMKWLPRLLFVLSRSLVILLLLAAAAGPYTIAEHIVTTDSPNVVVIGDRTDSMALFDTAKQDEIYEYLRQKTPTAFKEMTGNRTALGDTIIRNARSGSSILIITEGNNNYGTNLLDAVTLAKSINSTVYAVKQTPVKSDIGLTVSGNKKVIAGNKNTYVVEVRRVGSTKGHLTVWLDDKKVLEDTVSEPRDIPLVLNFDKVGSHGIKAEIIPEGEDTFADNNVFLKSVYVVPKPRILLVPGASSPLQTVLRALYTVETGGELSNLDSYSAVVLDNVHARDLSEGEVDALREYIENGGGVLVVGGNAAYDNGDYRNTPSLDALLPVWSVGGSNPNRNIGVVLIIDISGSTGNAFGENTKVDVEKAQALGILRSLGPKDTVGVIAFNNYAHIIAPFEKGQDFSIIENNISRLVFNGGTEMYPAQEAADNMMKGYSGTANIVILSDGMSTDQSLSIDMAQKMADKGIITHTVGVGSDTDTGFMSRLALAGGGVFLKPEESQRVSVLFGGSSQKKPESDKGFTLVVITSQHFITRGSSLDAFVTGYNDVTPKTGAQALVMTDTGKPVLTVWRLGLGRVVSLTTDDGLAWASPLYTSKNSRIVSTMVNWAVGDPERASELKIEAEDTSIGYPVKISVTSKGQPALTLNGEPLVLSRTGEKTYEASRYINDKGFADISGYSVAVNSPREFQRVGYNDELDAIIRAGGGKVYGEESVKELFIKDIIEKETRREQEKQDQKWIFLTGAMLVFLLEICVRRAAELMKLRRA